MIGMILSLLLSVQAKPMYVSEIQSETVYVVDETGNEWAFYGNGYNVEENVTVIMVDNAIVDVR